MEIKVLGGGCAKCKKLYENVLKCLEDMNITADVLKVEDFGEIMSFGVMSTPALVIDNQVVDSGKVTKPKEIAKLINKE